MNCNVIQDLLPLYVDECCSGESAELVKEHLEVCPKCKETFNCMGKPVMKERNATIPMVKLRRISDWKASVLQSAMLYLSFAMIVWGVILEGHTPAGAENGLWAVALIVPATANLLSLANWYFIRIYKNRRVFSTCSCLITAAMTVCGYAWAILHYVDGISWTSPLVILGAVISLVFVVLSKLFSHQYALLLGCE